MSYLGAIGEFFGNVVLFIVVTLVVLMVIGNIVFFILLAVDPGLLVSLIGDQGSGPGPNLLTCGSNGSGC